MLDSRLALTGAALAVVMAASYLAVRPPERPQLAPVSASAVETAGAETPEDEQVPEYMYIIKEHEGRVAVYPAGEAEPEFVLDVLVRYLPDLDRQQMQEGIPVADYDKLVALLEDFGS
jgi:hypothetical protein